MFITLRMGHLGIISFFVGFLLFIDDPTDTDIHFFRNPACDSIIFIVFQSTVRLFVSVLQNQSSILQKTSFFQWIWYASPTANFSSSAVFFQINTFITIIPVLFIGLTGILLLLLDWASMFGEAKHQCTSSDTGFVCTSTNDLQLH